MPRPDEYLRFCPIQYNRHAKTKKVAQMKEQVKAPKTELSDEEIANLSDAEFKTLVIRMLTELVECGCEIEEKVKATKSEIKEMHREPTVMGRKMGIKAMVWSRRKK